MRSSLIYLFASFLIVFSCSDSAGEKIPVRDPKPVSRIEEDDIFSGDVVKNFVAVSEAAVKEANQFFLQAIDIYRNKNNPSGSIALFVKSICMNPDSKSYYEMGNACADAGDLDKAIASYEMADKLGYEPFSKVLYNLACVYSRKKELDKSADYLEASLQAGYSNIDQIRKDKDLDALRTEDNYSYNAALKSGMSGMTNPEQLFWMQFVKSFAKVKSTFTLNGEKRQFKEEDAISFDYETYIAEMRNEKFSRDVGSLFFAVAEVPVADNIIALVYSEEDAYTEYPSIIYRLAIFTPEGKVLDKKVIAGRENMDQLQTAAFSKGGGLVVKTFDLEFTKDTGDNGYVDNPIRKKTLAATTSYKITSDGKIVEEPNV